MDLVSALEGFWVGWVALQGGARGVAMNGAREIVEWVGLVAAENLVELPEGPLKPPVSLPPVSLPPVSLPLERVVRFILPPYKLVPANLLVQTCLCPADAESGRIWLWSRVNFAKMASKRARESVEGDLKCSLCDQRFKFRSKYSRHLESSLHTRFQQSLDAGDLDAADGSSSGSSDLGVSDIILPSTSSFMAEDDDSSQVILNSFAHYF